MHGVEGGGYCVVLSCRGLWVCLHVKLGVLVNTLDILCI